MSLPKHDPGLAAFLKNLDPSLYTISGSEPPSAPIAKEIEGLRNDLESRYRESNVRREAELDFEYNSTIELPSRVISPYQDSYDFLSDMENELQRYKRK